MVWIPIQILPSYIIKELTSPKSSCCFQFDRKQHLSSPGSHCVPYVPSCPGEELSLPSNVDMDAMGGVFWVMGQGWNLMGKWPSWVNLPLKYS